MALKLMIKGHHCFSVLLAGLLAFGTSALAQSGPDRCVASAAQYHNVNDLILRAILQIESRMKERAVSRNRNGSVDVGIAGINSIHFKELARYGIAPENLFDACVSTYVAAWDLSKKISKWGNNWFGVAAYHSTTPYHNQRYQVLLHNELVSSGAINARRLAVPPLAPRPAASPAS